MTLGEKRRRFSRLLGHLLVKIQTEGYEAQLDEVKRTDEQAEIYALGPAGRARLAEAIQTEFPRLSERIRNNAPITGHRDSVHVLGLAADLDLFQGGRYLTDSEDHRPFGEFWERLDPLCRWGGRWGDGRHYSLEHEGIQ